MDNLTDDLLLEICRRLPHKDAARCRFISKRFLALISHFISQHILHHHNLFQHMNEEELEKEWRLHFLSRRKLLLLFLPTIHLSNNNQKQLSLGFIGPSFDTIHDSPTKKRAAYTRIVGCSNGLLLIRKSQREMLYFVCNPLTKDYIKVEPLALGFPPQPHDRVFEGLICESHYHVKEGNKVSLILQGHRFRVVRFPLFAGISSEFEMVVFSSETGQWTTNLVSCSKGSSFAQPVVLVPSVAHGRKLYFIGRWGLLVYDPFDNERQCDVIDYPRGVDRRDVAVIGHVGVSCGSIRLCVPSFFVSGLSPRTVFVWELKSDTNEWRLLHRTPLPHHHHDVAGSVRPELPYEVFGMGMRVRAFHPHHGDVVLFQHNHRLFYGNLKTKQFRSAAYGLHGFYDLQVVSLDLPWWSTPLPSITYINSAASL